MSFMNENSICTGRLVDHLENTKGFSLRALKYLVMDEGIHFNNAVNLIKKNHSDRIQEIPFLLEQISQLESKLRRYCKTFFLDHAQEQFRFPKNFNQVIIQMILARFGLDKFPNEANTLWSWKPDGCVLVPTVVPNGFSNL
jgi:hypothetical protein